MCVVDKHSHLSKSAWAADPYQDLRRGQTRRIERLNMVRLSLLLWLTTLLGCSGSSGTVDGVVQYRDGTDPLTLSGALVHFMPDDLDAPIYVGICDDEGAFVLRRRHSGGGAFALIIDSSDWIVPPGKYKVLLSRESGSYREPTPQKYARLETTPLQATVDAEHRHFDFAIDSK
jgi:hypothetical protein